jgi:hypothetical protein
MKRQNRLTSQTQAGEESLATKQTESERALQFATVEDLLRHDALHTPVPPRIAHRLEESIGKSAPPLRPWWRRFFGTSNE